MTQVELAELAYRKELRSALADCSEFCADIGNIELADRAEAMLSQVVAEDHEHALEARIPQEDELREALKEIFAIVQDSVLEQNYRIRDIIMNALRDQSVAALEGRSGE